MLRDTGVYPISKKESTSATLSKLQPRENITRYRDRVELFTDGTLRRVINTSRGDRFGNYQGIARNFGIIERVL